MNRYIALLALAACFPATATTTMCTIKSEEIGTPQSVMWDSKTGDATIRDEYGRDWPGRVVFTIAHSEFGKKVNVAYQDSIDRKLDPKHSEHELIIFPVAEGKFRVLSAGIHITDDGQHHFATGGGAGTAECQSL